MSRCDARRRARSFAALRMTQKSELPQICHPDKASDASGGRWLLASGQLRVSEAGSGSPKIAQRSSCALPILVGPIFRCALGRELRRAHLFIVTSDILKNYPGIIHKHRV